jgi:hypothetical protein
MDRKRPEQGWRAVAFAVALFAITLNFLQPLAHAALMRDSGTSSALMAAICLPSAGQDDTQGQAPAAGKTHECCLGLAHAPAIAEPSSAFVLIEPVVTAVHFRAAIDVLSSVDSRDGPSQPRAPPSFA